MIDKQSAIKEIILQAGGVFRSGSIVAAAQAAGISKRTADTGIEELCSNGTILLCRRGLYATSEFVKQNKDAALCAIAYEYQSASIVSLTTSLTDPSTTTSNKVEVVISAGKVGTIETGVGSIATHNVSRALLAKIESDFGSKCFAEPVLGVTRHSPSMAMAMASYLTMCGKRSGFSPEQARASVELVDWDLTKDMLSSARIPQYFADQVRENLAAGFNHSPVERDAGNADDSPSPF